MIQSLHESLTAEKLNELLAHGAVVAHILPVPGIITGGPSGRWDVVLDTPEPGEADESAVILRFLQGVNPATLEEAMARGARLSEGVGVSALKALAALVHPEQPG